MERFKSFISLSFAHVAADSFGCRLQLSPFESPGLNMPPAFLDSSHSFDYNFKFYGRDGEIRTLDLSVPNAAR